MSVCWGLIIVLKDDLSCSLIGEMSFEDGVSKSYLDVVCGKTGFCDESSSDWDSSELRGEESPFASLIGFEMLTWVESKKRMKLLKSGCKSGSFG